MEDKEDFVVGDDEEDEADDVVTGKVMDCCMKDTSSSNVFDASEERPEVAIS